MNRNINREEAFRFAAEKVRLKREKEEREENEFYQRITSGKQWFVFKLVVVFCTLMFLVSLIEVFVDGSSKKLTEKSWRTNRNWEYTWHKVLDVEGYMFTPTSADWSDRVDNSVKIVYSPIFRTGKKLTFNVNVNQSYIREQVEIRQMSIFNWFPFFQIFLLIPLATFIFKRKSAWFSFARIASFVLVFPGTLLVIFLTML